MKVIKVNGVINQTDFSIIEQVVVEGGELLARKTFQPSSKIRATGDVQTLRKRFIREVKIQETLPRELFIPIIYSSLVEATPWYLMPYADEVYTDHIALKRMNSEIPDGLSDILNSLEHLHDRGLVHRDLKPGNILLHESIWKVSDLGLISADAEFTELLTKTGDYGGTNPYMAPEQTTNFHDVTAQADIYSFGCILHDIFDGSLRVPYKRQTCKGSLGIIVEKCTEEKPEHRFPSVDKLRQILLSKLSRERIPRTADVNIKEWQEDFEDVESWDQDKFEAFVIFIDAQKESQETIFFQQTSGQVKHFSKFESRIWKRYILLYLEWIRKSSFDFDYCDVLIGHITTAYELSSDLEIKATAVLVAARLGSRHNRFYVMRRLFSMANHDIDDLLAERIAMEIYVDDSNVAKDFRNCAEEAFNKSVKSFHPKIEEVLIK